GAGGTYVRTLVHDLGAMLGCGAALAALRRTRSEPFAIERACPWPEFQARTPAELLARFGVALDDALAILPAVTLSESAVAAIGQGQRPRVEPGGAPLEAGPRSGVFPRRSRPPPALGGPGPARARAPAPPPGLLPPPRPP